MGGQRHIPGRFTSGKDPVFIVQEANEVLTSTHNCVSDLFAYDLDTPKRLITLNCTKITVRRIFTKNFLPEHSSVVKNLTAYIETHSAAVNCVLKPDLKVSSRNML